MESSQLKKIKTLEEAIAEMLQDARKEYEKRIGYEMNDSSRLSTFVQDRTALSNALRPYATLGNIGKLFDKDHSSIVHYIKEIHPPHHETQLKPKLAQRVGGCEKNDSYDA
jgi:chromosomal replication initiation ATPase DnaA